MPRTQLETCCKTAACLGPLLALVLIPKCPVCLASWVLVLTGVGISVSVATGIKVGLIAGGLILGGWGLRWICRKNNRGLQ